MRWPIHLQLLLPMLTVVVLAIVLASAASGYLTAMRVRQAQEENLGRVVASVTEAKYPLQDQAVLRLMKGLSGADFAFLDSQDRVQADTLSLARDDLRQLSDLPLAGDSGGLAASPSIALAGRTYLCQRLAVSPRGPTAQGGSLVVLYPKERWSQPMHQALYPALGAGAVAIVAVALVTTFLARRFVRPIRRLGDQTAAIAQGDFTPVAVSTRNDELRDLAVSINRMTERLGQYEREVRKSEQLRTLGQLGAGMAHQLRNAATGARMAIDLHGRECAAAAARESLDVARRQLRLMESYLQRFLTLSRPKPSSSETVPLDVLIEDVLALVRPACLHAGIELSTATSEGALCVRGDPEELRQLLVNLLLNAVDATSGHGGAPARIVVELARRGDDCAAIHVKDTGPGPTDIVAARLFEPFVTGKPDGTGLGLFVARQIAEDHGGTLRWERRDGITRFTVELPVVKG
jgi:signal transduction histidine kinase